MMQPINLFLRKHDVAADADEHQVHQHHHDQEEEEEEEEEHNLHFFLFFLIHLQIGPARQ